VLLTTHYMDEAERCHRLAFIFRGSVLDVGTPDEIVSRRALRGVELELDDASHAADVLRATADVDEVAHYGNVLRVVTRGGADAESLARTALSGLTLRSVRPVRIGVEDAFVSMVREDAAPSAEVRS
jgi:ABC-2 type transport system ATP-binding protein